MILSLYKQTNISIRRFIEQILELYYSKTLADGDTFNDEINSVVKKMTGCDLYDYDNTYEVMKDILDSAIVYANEYDYPEQDINALMRIAFHI